jgi:hypothetical protein
LVGVPLTEIDQCNRDFRQTGHTSYPLQEIDLETQLYIMKSWIWSVVERLAVA